MLFKFPGRNRKSGRFLLRANTAYAQCCLENFDTLPMGKLLQAWRPGNRIAIVALRTRFPRQYPPTDSRNFIKTSGKRKKNKTYSKYNYINRNACFLIPSMAGGQVNKFSDSGQGTPNKENGKCQTLRRQKQTTRLNKLSSLGGWDDETYPMCGT